MAIKINSEAQLKSELQKITNLVLSEVTYELYGILIETIEKNVYEPFDSGNYTRLGINGGFLSAWDMNVIGNKGEIYFEPSRMDYNPDELQHGWASVGDLRKEMASIIESGTMQAYEGSRPARPFWDEFIQAVDSKLLNQFITKAYLKHGIQVRRT